MGRFDLHVFKEIHSRAQFLLRISLKLKNKIKNKINLKSKAKKRKEKLCTTQMKLIEEELLRCFFSFQLQFKLISNTMHHLSQMFHMNEPCLLKCESAFWGTGMGVGWGGGSEWMVYTRNLRYERLYSAAFLYWFWCGDRCTNIVLQLEVGICQETGKSSVLRPTRMSQCFNLLNPCFLIRKCRESIYYFTL